MRVWFPQWSWKVTKHAGDIVHIPRAGHQCWPVAKFRKHLHRCKPDIILLFDLPGYLYNNALIKQYTTVNLLPWFICSDTQILYPMVHSYTYCPHHSSHEAQSCLVLHLLVSLKAGGLNTTLLCPSTWCLGIYFYTLFYLRYSLYCLHLWVLHYITANHLASVSTSTLSDLLYKNEWKEAILLIYVLLDTYRGFTVYNSF